MQKWFTPLAAAAVLACSVPGAAQDSSNAEILGAVDTFLDGLNTRDPAKLASVATEQGLLVAHQTRDGKSRVRTRTFADDLATIDDETDALREVYWDPTVLVRGNIAVVWAEYSFDYKGERSHCGIDVFNLMKIDGAWKITGIQYTVEPDNCPEGR